MSAALDLFGTPIVPGFASEDCFVAVDEEAALIDRIDAEALAPFRYQGWLGKRLTLSFGWSYDFDTGHFARTELIPGWLEPLKARAAAFAGLDAEELVQALLIRYDPGAGIGWHRDRPVFEHVIGISLGNAATMRLRRRVGREFKRVSAPLPSRAIYHLTGEVRHEWEHSIEPIKGTRWSITFRTLPKRKRGSSAIG